jgi:dihydroorotate dehydrogenase (NAD+) catalytic subunit
MGGISTGRDALEFLAAGAEAVALGTILFADPEAPSRIRAELHEAAEAAGVASADDAIALAHESGPLEAVVRRADPAFTA